MIAQMIKATDRLTIDELKGHDATLGADPAHGPDTARHIACPQ
jgi:hypothetical protein